MDRREAERLYNTGKEPTVVKLLELDAENEQLKKQVAKLSRNSRDSHKPPSSDIVKPACDKKKKGKRRKIGGQPGHKRHERPSFTPEQIDEMHVAHLESCPDCQGRDLIKRPEEDLTIQRVKLPKKLLLVEEYRAEACWCVKCQKIVRAPMPPEAQESGFFDERLVAMLCILKYRSAVSFSKIVEFLSDVFALRVSTGYLAKLMRQGAGALDPAYQQLLAALPHVTIVNTDETGHKENGKRFWTWCFRTELFTLFKIDESRGSGVLIEVLGKEFDGVLGCDYFSAYRKYMKDFNVVVQFCLAHLIRDIKFLLSLPDSEAQLYGYRLLQGLRKIFGVIHRRELMKKQDFDAALERAKKKILRLAQTDVPSQGNAFNIAARFKKHGEAYFEFITTPGIEPTNNLAERAIRFIVMYRHSSQGTRSAAGRYACERFWTVISTCLRQGKSVFHFITHAIKAKAHSIAPPLLLINDS